ncbi:MAG: ring-opening amidohydrolase [Pseudomonadota bacterium]
MRRAFVHCIPTGGPEDVGGLIERINTGKIVPTAIKAILGKTEGNGCVNDFTRGYAVQSLRASLSPWLDSDELNQVAMIMSGGTEGGLSPHILVFEAREVDGSKADGEDTMALALAVAQTAPMRPEMIGRAMQSQVIADAVRASMTEARIDRPENVHYVQVKCPLLTAARIDDSAARGESVATTDTLKSMGLSRGASALGVALALGEVDPESVTDEAIAGDMSLYSTRASCSAGVELMNNEILVIGNSSSWAGDLVISHDVMADAIDSQAIYRALEAIGLNVNRQLSHTQQTMLKAVLAKAEADPQGAIRGARHTMLDDSDISSTRHARALVGGVLAGILGQTDLFISGGAEHQGPAGGGPIAIIGHLD